MELENEMKLRRKKLYLRGSEVPDVTFCLFVCFVANYKKVYTVYNYQKYF
jgi:hypothetical protein